MTMTMTMATAMTAMTATATTKRPLRAPTPKSRHRSAVLRVRVCPGLSRSLPRSRPGVSPAPRRGPSRPGPSPPASLTWASISASRSPSSTMDLRLRRPNRGSARPPTRLPPTLRPTPTTRMLPSRPPPNHRAVIWSTRVRSARPMARSRQKKTMSSRRSRSRSPSPHKRPSPAHARRSPSTPAHPTESRARPTNTSPRSPRSRTRPTPPRPVCGSPSGSSPPWPSRCFCSGTASSPTPEAPASTPLIRAQAGTRPPTPRPTLG